MLVYVVMGNDFPDAVFSRLEDAENYCRERRAEEKPRQLTRRIYWRVYDFKLDEKLEDARLA